MKAIFSNDRFGFIGYIWMRMLYLPKLINSNGFVCANEAPTHSIYRLSEKIKISIGT